MSTTSSAPTYTISEAAALTGLHRNTIRQRIKAGQLEASVQIGKFGEEYRITRDALRRAGLLTEEEPLRGGPALDPDILDAEFEPRDSGPGAEADGTGLASESAAGPVAVAALQELYQRHEQAMFRLGYMQAELERLKALAERAESLQEDNHARQSELQSLKTALDQKEQAAAEAEALRRELERAREHLREMETLRRDLDQLKALAEQQEKTIGLLEATKRPWWRFW